MTARELQTEYHNFLRELVSNGKDTEPYPWTVFVVDVVIPREREEAARLRDAQRHAQRAFGGTV